MGAVMNGMALHGGVLPVGGTFFVFSDYMRPAVRLAALSQAARDLLVDPRLDRPGRGRPDPPARRAAGRRCGPCPGLVVVRPADANETAQAWRLAVESRRSRSGLVLSRQDIPVLAETAELAAAGVAKGGYVLAEAVGAPAPQIVLIGTGSEVQLCLGAATALGQAGVAARVVSLPCWEWFEEQTRTTGPRSSRPGCPPSAWRRARRSAGAATPTPP